MDWLWQLATVDALACSGLRGICPPLFMGSGHKKTSFAMVSDVSWLGVPAGRVPERSRESGVDFQRSCDGGPEACGGGSCGALGAVVVYSVEKPGPAVEAALPCEEFSCGWRLIVAATMRRARTAVGLDRRSVRRSIGGCGSWDDGLRVARRLAGPGRGWFRLRGGRAGR